MLHFRCALGAVALAPLFFCSLTAQAQANTTPRSLPIAFEENRGQSATDAAYHLHRDAVDAFFVRDGVDLRLGGATQSEGTLHLRFVRGSGAPVGKDQLSGHANYLIGRDSSRWVRNVPLYSEVDYTDIYPGISLSFYGNEKDLEHDFQVAPGADPAQIAFRVDNSSDVEVLADGDLRVDSRYGALTLEKPVAYQMTAGRRRSVDAEFLVGSDKTVRFKIGSYDRNAPLVIDPVLVFSTYLGGTGTDTIYAATTDASGNVLVTGTTTSTDFPVKNPEQGIPSSCASFGCTEVFVTKLDPAGKTLIYSTYLGGTGNNQGAAIAVDGSGNAIVGGTSSSQDFPQAGSINSSSCQINDGCYFLASLKPDGSALNYSGLIGGQQGNYAGNANDVIAVDQTGNAYLGGVTDDAHFQITPGTLTTTVSGYPYDQMFVLKVDPTGKLIYSTIVPGNGSQDPSQPFNNAFYPTGIAVDTSGNVTASGWGGLGLPTTAGVVSEGFPNASVNVESPTAGFVLQLDATASAINFASYLPGTDKAGGLAVDSKGDLWVAGTTSETTLPVSANAYQKTPSTSGDSGPLSGYILEVDPKATTVMAATYLDGSGQSDESSSFSAIALDSKSNVWVGGMTSSADFPLQDPFVTELETTGSIDDMIVAEMSSDLSKVEFGSFLNSVDPSFEGSSFSALTVDASDHVIVAGYTDSKNFPTTAGSFEPSLPPPASQYSIPLHSFVVSIDPSVAAPAVCFDTLSVNLGSVNANASASQTVHVTNCGNAALDISGITSSDPTVKAQQSCGTIAPAGVCAVTLTFTPVSSATTTGTVTLSDNAITIPQTIQFTGQGIAPKISSSNQLAFGHFLVGTQGPTLVLGIANQGQATLAISSVKVSGNGFSLVQTDCIAAIPQFSGCDIQLAFEPPSPGALTGSVVIDSNDPVTPQLTVALTGTGDAAYSVASITSIGAGTVQINNGPAQLTVTGANFYPQSIVQVNGVAQASTFVNNGTLQVTVAASSLTALGELPLTVVNPTPGGGSSPAAVITPYETLTIDPVALVSVPSTGMLYAAIAASGAENPNTVVPVDPTTGTVGTAIPVQEQPDLLAPSSDGAYLYVANDGAQTVQRINLKTNAVERTFDYTPNLYCSDCSNLSATDLASVPGSPTEVVLSQGEWLTLYNDSGRVNYVPNDGVCCYADPDFGSIALAGNPLTVYGLPFSFGGNYFQIAGITGSGLTYQRPTGSNTGQNNSTGAQVISDGTLLYTSAGEIWDPASQQQVGSFPIQSYDVTSYPNQRSIALDSSAGEFYSIGDQNYNGYSSAIVISAYSLKTYALTGSLAFPQLTYPLAGDIVRWGTDGLAFISSAPSSSDLQIYLLRSSVVSPSSLNPLPILTKISPTSANAGGVAFTLTVSGSGFLSSSTALWNGNALTTQYVSATQLTASVPASLIAQAGTAQVAVSNPGPGGGSSSVIDFAIAGTTTSTTTTLSASPAGGTLTAGSTFSLTATVAPSSGTGVPSGNVVFTIGTTTQTVALNGSGVAVWTGSAPSTPGTLSASAAYQGSQQFGASTSATLTFTVAAPANALPALNGLSPAFVSAGGAAFTLTVSGSGFVPGSTLYWGSTAITTQVKSATQLTGQIPASAIANAGAVALTVQNPSPGAGTSNALQFEVDSANSSSFAPVISTSTATVAPGSTANYLVTLPSSATNVSASCLNLPSGATCSYSAANGTLSIATVAGTPAGNWQITVVFTETVPVATAAVLSLSLLPIAWIRYRSGRGRVRYLSGIALLFATVVLLTSCGGGGGKGTTSPPPTTQQVTSSVSVALDVQ
jgi:Bacterial Ig-like domain (group 3)/Abnormal spindle-like microcephaly-assoc'd, ASPM-SPD-2-Hydin/Beta-propeller repeat